MSEKTVRVAVIGAGMAGQAHAFGYRNASMADDLAGLRVELTHLVDAYAPAAEAAAGRYGFQQWGTDLQAVLENPEIDVISVALPNEQHREVLSKVLASGKHVFTEKPLGLSWAEAMELTELAEQYEAVHGVGFSYRHLPGLAALAGLVSDGKLGTPYHFEARYLCEHAADPADPHTWRFDQARSGGGALVDLGIHAIDAVRFVVGEIDEVISAGTSTVISHRVPAQGGEPVAVTNDDVTAAVFRSGQAVGTFLTSRVSRGEPNKLELTVHGSLGSGGFSSDRSSEFWVYDSTVGNGPMIDGPQRVVVGAQHPHYADVSSFRSRGVGTGYGEAFIAEMQEFLRSVVTGAPMKNDFSTAVAAMRVVEDIYVAAGTRQVVTS